MAIGSTGWWGIIHGNSAPNIWQIPPGCFAYRPQPGAFWYIMWPTDRYGEAF